MKINIKNENSHNYVELVKMALDSKNSLELFELCKPYCAKLARLMMNLTLIPQRELEQEALIVSWKYIQHIQSAVERTTVIAFVKYLRLNIWQELVHYVTDVVVPKVPGDYKLVERWKKCSEILSDRYTNPYWKDELEEQEYIELDEITINESNEIEDHYNHDHLVKEIETSKLGGRLKDIFYLHVEKDYSLEEIGEIYNISKERVQLIYVKCCKELSKRIYLEYYPYICIEDKEKNIY